jgi:uncharacterized protein (UPF0261 family)/ABC-type branched-subunit amino acid transport system ATPase component
MVTRDAGGAGPPILEVVDLHVHYGHAHVLQGVTLRLDHGVLGLIGRNGMGKTTLCQAIMGLKAATSGSIRIAGTELVGLPPNRIARLGIGYVPQGRRTWPSLSVDEHLRLVERRAARGAAAPWTIERVYDAFPRLAERRRNGGTQLSGGEQQMLAIGRALLLNPRLLIMDEPTEGLAPVIVEQVETLLKRLAADGSLSVLLVEQNLGVATETAETVAIMVNGRLARTMPAAELAADKELQQRFLGVRSDGAAAEPALESAPVEAAPVAPAEPVSVVRVVRRAESAIPGSGVSTLRQPTRWNAGDPLVDRNAALGPAAARGEGDAAPVPESPAIAEAGAIAALPVAQLAGRAAYVVGTFDTKGRELQFLEQCIERLGIRVVTVDLSTSRKPSAADVGAAEVARFHPKGISGVFTGDRGTAVAAMATAFERFIVARRDCAGIVSAGGSGGTSLATPGMRRLAIGVPKVMVSTVASGDVGRYVGPADIMMMYSVTDVSGINRISEQVLSNAAHALAGMIAHQRKTTQVARPALGMTMFGVTTPCVQEVQRLMQDDFDVLVFHATGTGGQSMEKLADSGLMAGLVDITTTEVCDFLVGGILPCTEDRFGAAIRTRLPCVVSCGALDMVNFGPKDTVPSQFRGRNLYVHNPQVTLMRTTPEECARIGAWIAERLNLCEGELRLLIPEGGVSALDAPGKPFWDPAADKALFDALQRGLRQTDRRRIQRLPHNINDPAFARALAETWRAIARTDASTRSTAPATGSLGTRRAH